MTIYEQILAGLQTKFQGADSATLNRIATAKATGITDETQVKTLIEGVNWTDVMTSYADFRANEATKNSISNYEKKYGIKEGKPLEDPTKVEDPKKVEVDPTKTPDIAALVNEAVLNAVKPLTDELTTLKNEKTQLDFGTRVSEAAKKYGINENLAKMLNVPQDADLDKFMQEAKQSFTDAGFQEVVPPASADQQVKTESESIAKQISDGTKTIVEQQKK